MVARFGLIAGALIAMAIMNVLRPSQAVSPPPPPPPPVGTVDLFLVTLSQSNGLNMGSASAFVAKYKTLTGRDAEVVNCARGSSGLRAFIGYANWEPGPGSLFDASIATYKNKLLSNPNYVAAGFLSWIGENDSAIGAEANALHHATDLVDRTAYLRSQGGSLWGDNLRAFVMEIHQWPLPNSSFPLWPDVQFQIRKATNASDPYGLVPNAYPISIADLVGAGADRLHLDAATNAIAQERWAIVAAGAH